MEPYALKEFKSRWYLLAKDLKNNEVRCFGLDRLTGLQTTEKTFNYPDDYDVEDYYRYNFGVIKLDDQESQEITLLFDSFQGKYIKTLPLHETQKIVVDNVDELQVELKLNITEDFIMELLSFGSSLQVLKPNVNNKFFIILVSQDVKMNKLSCNVSKCFLYFCLLTLVLV